MQFVMATNNLKKRDEMERILKELGIEVLTAKQAGADLGDVEETGTTFEENAALKARSACVATGLPSVADDSGLEVDALGGARECIPPVMRAKMRLTGSESRSCWVNCSTYRQRTAQPGLSVPFAVLSRTAAS